MLSKIQIISYFSQTILTKMAEATLPFPVTLADILKDTNYKLTQFSHDKNK